MAQAPTEFTTAASEETIQRVAEQIRQRNIAVIIVDDANAAHAAIFERLPKGAEVHSAKSKTLQDLAILDTLHDPDQYDALRPRYLKMDRQTQAREIRKLVSAPDYMLGSVNALTEDGVLVATSASAMQIGAYAFGAGKLILVVGSQKIVPDLATALRRVEEHVLPWEDAQLRSILPSGSFLGKTLLIEREWITDRTTVVLVRQPLGI